MDPVYLLYCALHFLPVSQAPYREVTVFRSPSVMVHERTVSRHTVPATMRPATMRPATMRPATMHPATMRPTRMRPATMRRIDLQIVRWRHRAQAPPFGDLRPAPARPTTVSFSRFSRTEIPERRHSISVRLTRSSILQLRGRMHPGPVSDHGAEQGSTPFGCSTIPTPPAQSRSSTVGRPRTGAPARSFHNP